MRRMGALRATALVVVLAALMFGLGVVFTRGGPVTSAPPAGRTASAGIPATGTGQDLGAAISTLQTRLRRLPGDYTSWASLGTAYVQQAAVTGDPTYYPKARGALRRSLRLEPSGNAAALTGLASLAAAQHEFAVSLGHARDAQRINPYSAANQGILSDALIQLGRYRESFTELQRMLDLQPGVPSFTRASYAYELRGQLRAAEAALQRALEIASRPSDIAFVLYYLGELEWNSGDLEAADAYYAQGLEQDPDYALLLAGRAKVAAARGDITTAVQRYDEVVRRQPVPTHLIAYADLLRSLGRDEAATRQEAVVRATEALFEDAGANVDVELALFDADHGRPEAALRAARSGWQQQQGVDASDAYAWALHVNGKDRSALGYAREAARLGTKSALFAYHRGMIEKSLGMRSAALASLRRSLELNPQFSPLHVPRAEAAIQELASR